MIDSIILMTDERTRRSFEAMSAEDAGNILKGLLRHAAGEEIDDSGWSPLALAVYPLIEGQVDRMADLREKRSAAGKASAEGRAAATCNKLATNLQQVATNGQQVATPVPVPVPVPVPEPIPVPVPAPEPVPDKKSPDGDERKTPSGSKESAVDAVPEFRQDFVREAWGSYTKMRRKIKKPMTEEAERLAVKKLKDLSRGDPIRAVKILEQSVFNGWQGLFDLKSEKQKTTDWSAV